MLSASLNKKHSISVISSTIVVVVVHAQRAYTHSPGTQMTRVLAVSLVHTARVLEVFVAVVLVGEHLAAPLTRVALARCKTKHSLSSLFKQKL